MTNINNLPPDARHTVQITMMLSGIIMLVVSTYFILDPAAVKALTGLGKQTTQTLAIAFMLIGAFDIAASLIIFRKKDRK